MNVDAAAQTCEACDTPLPAADAPCPSCTAELKERDSSSARTATIVVEDRGETLTPRKPGFDPEGETGDILIGVTIGKCKITDKIGQGGMGAVYRARHEALDRDVVVKILPPAYTNIEEFRERFVREAQAAAKLSHPNVVQVHDVGQERGLLFYVMELVDGRSLETMCVGGERVEPREAIRLIREAAKGLGAAHDSGIIHRDVKAANILLCESGEVKVTDFGVARDQSKDRLSSVGQLLGTPHYMAPEQAEGQADPRSDLYALGVTLFQLLSGQLPFEGNSYLSIIRKHREQKPPGLRDLVPGLPDTVCRVVARLLQKDPKKRYQNMAELITDLDRLHAELSGDTTTPPPLYAQPEPSPWFGRILLLALGGVCLLAVGYWGPKATRAPKPSPRDSTAETPTISPPPTRDDDVAAVESAPPEEHTGPIVRPVPSLALVTPPEALMTRESTATITVEVDGEASEELNVSAPGATVTRNGRHFELALSGLQSGENPVTVVGSDGDRQLSPLDVVVVRDTTPPWLEIDSPRAEQVSSFDDTGAPRLDVLARARDPHLEQVEARIDLDGRSTSVVLERGPEGYAGELPLTLSADGRRASFVGRLEVTVKATDRAGNANVLKLPVVVVPRGMVYVPGGAFRTGGRTPGLPPPRDQVGAGFFIDAHEVTNARYHAYVVECRAQPPRSRAWPEGSFVPELADHPVQGVTYDQAKQFADWSDRDLPSEVQWEKAAAWDGRRHRRFPWGDGLDPARANTEDHWTQLGRSPQVTPVGQFDGDKSAVGCYDMGGNLQEWTTSVAASDGTRHVLKGGCYLDRQAAGMTARRELREGAVALEQVGFRCVRDLDPGLEVQR